MKKRSKTVAAILLSIILVAQVVAPAFATTIINTISNTDPVIPVDVVPFGNWIDITLDPNFGGNASKLAYFNADGGVLPDDCGYLRNGYALAGWSLSPDGKIDYDLGAPVSSDLNGQTLYAVWCPLCFRSEESFTIRNSSEYFNVNGKNNYYIEDDDYNMMQKNLYKVFLPSPVPETILSAVLATYPNWSWRGSCYGIAATAALQHEGIVDVVGTQGVDNLSDLEPTEDLISFINYYQSQAATSFLCEHKAFVKGTPNYKQQLRELYESVAAGNLVLFTFYTGNAFVTPGHTVLITGAYKDAAGNYVLIAYDSNYGSYYYYSYYVNRFTISPDFSTVSYCDEELGAINWVDDFSQFSSFDINGNGSAATWHQVFFAHVRQLFASFAAILRAFFN